MSAPARALAPGRAWAIGTLIVAVLDITDAFVFFAFRGVPPRAILQSIASGVLGREAYRGGWATAALGLGLHVVVAVIVVGIFLAAARRWRALATQPFLWGPLYGLVVYLTMTRVVMPLSAFAGGGRGPDAAGILNGVAIHLLGVGLPCALVARWATRGRT